MKILVISTDGTISADELSSGQTLDQLQQLVGGYIQILDLAPGLALVFNEEGKIARLAPNDTATRLTQHFAVGLHPDDFIAGPAALVGQREGETTPVPDLASDVLHRLGFLVSTS